MSAPAASMRIKSRGGGGGRSKDVPPGVSVQQPAIRLKAVIRHLPALIKQSEFLETMSNFINDDTTDSFTWIQGKVSEESVLTAISRVPQLTCQQP